MSAIIDKLSAGMDEVLVRPGVEQALEIWFRQVIDGDAAEAPLEYAALKAA